MKWLSFFSESPKYCFKKSVLIIGSSILITLFFFFLAFWLWSNIKKRNDETIVTAIIQTSKQYQSLPNEFFAEFLHLSIDHPKRKKDISLKAEERALIETNLFTTLQLSFFNPSTLFVSYELRKPIAQLADFSNTVISEEGFLIPQFPFFSFKRLPKLKIGLECDPKSVWSKKIEEEKLNFFKQFAHLFKNLEMLDLTDCEAVSLGNRQIIAHLKEENKILFIRMPVDEIESSVSHYFCLKKTLESFRDFSVVDLRCKDVAYLSTRNL